MATEAVPAGDRIDRFFDGIEAEKALVDTLLTLYRTTSAHFSALRQSFASRSEDLDAKLKALDSETEETLKSLSDREDSIPALRSAAEALVEERRVAVVTELANFSTAGGGVAVDLKETLRRYCRWMDSAGLWRFMVARRKDLGLLRREVTDAVGLAVDPARLVLDAVEDFLNHLDADGGSRSEQYWACGMLLTALLDAEERSAPNVSGRIRTKAGEVAESWKKKVDEREEGKRMGGSEALMFLQFLVAFGVHSRFDEEFLRKLVLEFASKKGIPKIAAELGFGEKMGDTIDELVREGKELEAVYFAHECGLTERFSPISLLLAYQQNVKNKADDILEKGKRSTAATEEASNFELAALRSIVKCVQMLKLEAKFSLESAKKRISSLEKVKADRKRNAAGSKLRFKRSRVNGPGFRPAKAGRTPSSPYPSYHRGQLMLHRMPAPRPTFNNPGYGGGYEGARSAAYGASPSQTSALLPQNFNVPDDVGGSQAPRGPYGGPSASYSGYESYDYTAGMAPAGQPTYPQQHSYAWHS